MYYTHIYLSSNSRVHRRTKKQSHLILSLNQYSNNKRLTDIRNELVGILSPHNNNEQGDKD